MILDMENHFSDQGVELSDIIISEFTDTIIIFMNNGKDILNKNMALLLNYVISIVIDYLNPIKWT